jgi:hypothetical protein
MRKLVTWVIVSLGVAALVRKLRRRDESEWSVDTAVAPSPSSVGVAQEDPADELRRKLDETRTEGEASTPAAAESSVEERRAEVHDQGRAALDEMQPPDDGE